MKTKHKVVGCSLALSLCMACDAQDHPPSELDNVRAQRQDGSFAEPSNQALALMRTDVESLGEIQVWAVLDMEYTPNPERRTPELVQAEAAKKASLIAEVIQPLVEQGDARLIEPNHPQLAAAPGVDVVVTAQGLETLIRSPVITRFNYHHEP